MTSSPYIPSTDNDRKEMIEAIGVKNFEGLLTDIPKNFLLFSDNKLKEAGLSRQKISYGRDLAENINSGSLLT